MTAAEIRAAIRQLPLTHANLTEVMAAAAAFAGAMWRETSLDGMYEVSALADSAADACEDVYAREAA